MFQPSIPKCGHRTRSLAVALVIAASLFCFPPVSAARMSPPTPAPQVDDGLPDEWPPYLTNSGDRPEASDLANDGTFQFLGRSQRGAEVAALLRQLLELIGLFEPVTRN